MQEPSTVRQVDMMWHNGGKMPNVSLNSPLVFAGEDGKSYLVKFNREDSRIGINELVCSLIGLELELPLFEPIIAVVNSEIIESNSRLEGHMPGKHFASEYMEPFETVQIRTGQRGSLRPDDIGNIRMVPEFVIFDKYIENFDRHAGNVHLRPNDRLANKMDYYLFDHDLAFQRDQRHPDVSKLREMERKLQIMSYIVESITKMRDFERILGKIERLGSSISNIIRQIPADWRGDTEYISQIETLLMCFKEEMGRRHIRNNKAWFPNLK